VIPSPAAPRSIAASARARDDHCDDDALIAETRAAVVGPKRVHVPTQSRLGCSSGAGLLAARSLDRRPTQMSPTRSRGAWRWENESNRRDGEDPDVELGRGERGIADDSRESGANGEGQAGRPLRRGNARVPSSAERQGKPVADWLSKAGGEVLWAAVARATTSLPPPSLSQSSRAGPWRSFRQPRTHSDARASQSERRRDQRSRASSRTSRRPWRCG
jgi:hypothetical protein